MIYLSDLDKRLVHYMEGDSYWKAKNMVEMLIRASLTNSDSKKSKDSHYIAETLTVPLTPSTPSSIVKQKPSTLISFINYNAKNNN